MSVLHINNVDQRAKARWVAIAKHQGKTLPEWVVETLNAASDQVDLPPPLWMQRAGFSDRLSRCLTEARLVDPLHVRAACRDMTRAQWEALPNFGHRCYQELQAWAERQP